MPDLPALLRDPAKAAEMTPAEAQALIAPLTVLLAALWVRLSVPAPRPEAAPASADAEYLDAEQVHARFGLSPQWLREHRKPLAKLGLTREASRKKIVYSVKGLRTFLEHRRATHSLQAEDGRPAVHSSLGGRA